MTLDEMIKDVETIAEANQKVIDTGIVFNDVPMLYCDNTEEKEKRLANYQRRAEENRQLAEWLKDYKRLLEQEPLEDIKAEIQATIDEEKTGNGNINKGVVIGLQMALDMVNKHIDGKAESEEK